jgi:hypothetical protein
MITYNHGGLGDTIRGMLALYSYFQENPGNFKVYIPDHPLQNCIECIKETMDIPTLDFTYESYKKEDFNTFISSGKDYIILSNLYEYIPLEILKKHATTFNIGYKKNVIDNINDLRPKIPYVSIQIRCGDYHMTCPNQVRDDNRIVPFSGVFYTKLKKSAEFLIQNFPGRLIYLFTDSTSVRNSHQHLSDCVGVKLYFLDTKIHHTASADSDVRPFIDSLTEFDILGRSDAVVTFNKTGFSFWSTFINNTDLFLCDDNFTISQLYSLN